MRELTSSGSKKGRVKRFDEMEMQQMSLFDTVDNDKIIAEIRDLDISNMTPLDALNMLNHLQGEIRNRW